MGEDKVVLVKHGTRRQKLKGQWLLDVQRAADQDAVVEWAKKPVAPFEVVPPLKGGEWSGPALYAFGRGVYRQINRLIP